jgi:hypothetical protein
VTSASPVSADVLVIDAANVVGSRPDGWWNDRAGAAAKLYTSLVDRPGLAPRIVVVLEGRARAGVPASVAGVIEVVHAAGEGDDAIVEQVSRVVARSETVAVVTADRGLAARVERLGARRIRPGWLLSALHDPQPAADQGADPDPDRP